MANIVIEVGCGRLTFESKPVAPVVTVAVLHAAMPIFYYGRPLPLDVELLFGAQGILGPPNWQVVVDSNAGTVQLIAN